MALSILNNIPSLAAQNQLAITGSGLQKTLFRLSSGSRINSGADDAAGLATADGLHANITALTQSARNANDGVGMLQVADGALAQVTTVLNRAVTLATESATGTVSDPQRKALDAEFAAIKTEITSIGNKTQYNSTAVFGTIGSTTDRNTWQGATKLGATATAAGNVALTSGTITLTDSDTGKSETFTGAGGGTIQTLVDWVNNAARTENAVASLVNVDTSGVAANADYRLQIADKNGNGSIVLSADATVTGVTGAVAQKTVTASDIYLGDGTTGGVASISVSIGTMSASKIGFTAGLTPVDLIESRD